MKGLNSGERGGHSGYPLVKKYLFQVHLTHLWGRLSSVTSPDLPPNKVLIEKEEMQYHYCMALGAESHPLCFTRTMACAISTWISV